MSNEKEEEKWIVKITPEGIIRENPNEKKYNLHNVDDIKPASKKKVAAIYTTFGLICATLFGGAIAGAIKIITSTNEIFSQDKKEDATKITGIKYLNKETKLMEEPNSDNREIIGFFKEGTFVIETDGIKECKDKENKKITHRYKQYFVYYQDKWREAWIDDGTKFASGEEEELDNDNMDEVPSKNMETITVVKTVNKITGIHEVINEGTQGIYSGNHFIFLEEGKLKIFKIGESVLREVYAKEYKSSTAEFQDAIKSEISWEYNPEVDNLFELKKIAENEIEKV